MEKSMTFQTALRAATTSAIVLLLCACAGAPFKWSDARRIQPGMTAAEVTALMGPPTSVTSRDDAVRYVWVFVNGMTASSRTMSVDFRNDRVIRQPEIPQSFTD